MKNCEHIIGVLHDYENTETTTYEKLVKTVNYANDISKKAQTATIHKFARLL